MTTLEDMLLVGIILGTALVVVAVVDLLITKWTNKQ